MVSSAARLFFRLLLKNTERCSQTADSILFLRTSGSVTRKSQLNPHPRKHNQNEHTSQHPIYSSAMHDSSMTMTRHHVRSWSGGRPPPRRLRRWSLRAAGGTPEGRTRGAAQVGAAWPPALKMMCNPGSMCVTATHHLCARWRAGHSGADAGQPHSSSLPNLRQYGRPPAGDRNGLAPRVRCPLLSALQR